MDHLGASLARAPMLHPACRAPGPWDTGRAGIRAWTTPQPNGLVILFRLALGPRRTRRLGSPSTPTRATVACAGVCSTGPRRADRTVGRAAVPSTSAGTTGSRPANFQKARRPPPVTKKKSANAHPYLGGWVGPGGGASDRRARGPGNDGLGPNLLRQGGGPVQGRPRNNSSAPGSSDARRLPCTPWRAACSPVRRDHEGQPTPAEDPRRRPGGRRPALACEAGPNPGGSAELGSPREAVPRLREKRLAAGRRRP